MVSLARHITVIQGATSETLQALLVETANALRADGVKVIGVTAQGTGAQDRMCTAGFLCDLGSSDQFQIYLEEAPSDTSCDLDARGVGAACASVMGQIDDCDLVVLSKFGKLEAMRQGLFPAFEAAIVNGRPIVTTVSPKHREAWQAFAPNSAYVDADQPALKQLAIDLRMLTNGEMPRNSSA